MANIEHSSSSTRAKVASVIGGGGGTAFGLLASHYAGFESFLPKLLTVCACIAIGIVLAQLAARK